MKMRSLLLGAVATVALVGTASADHNGWYLGLEGGVVWIDDVEGSNNGTPFPAIGMDMGWAALGTVGHHFGNNWRWEVEVGYRTNDDDTGFAQINEWSGMFNVLYDFRLGQSLTMSLGAGAGADNFELEISPVGFQDRDWTFAYQGIGGLSWAISDRLDLFANYRYLRVSEPNLASTISVPPGFANIDLDDVSKHTVTLGLRYNFGAAPPPPPPVVEAPPPPPPPAAVTPKEFIVFFGHNKSNLTPEAMDVVKQAAAAAKEYGSATVTVVGHADKSGSPVYNQKLSQRRADAVKGALVGEGIEGGKISTSAKGESDPMVQTDDGVREPQNRRVHINL